MGGRGIVLLFTTLLVLCGCGRKPAKPEGKVAIRYANPEGVIEQVNLTKEIVKEFEKRNPDIEVKYEWGADIYKILTQIAGGVSPDVIYLGIVPAFKEKGAIVSLTPYIKKYNIDLSQYFKDTIDLRTFDEELYGLSMQVITFALFYNKDLFDKEGISYPDENWTWEDFYEAAKRLTKEKNGEKKDQFGAVIGNPMIYIHLNGEEIVDKDNRCTIDNERTKRIMEILYKIEKETSPGLAERQSFYRGSEPVYIFQTGKVAMFISPVHYLVVLFINSVTYYSLPF